MGNYTLDTITSEVKVLAANVQKAVITMGRDENSKNVVCKIIKSKYFAKTIDDLYFPFLEVQNNIEEVRSQLKRFNSHCRTHYPNAAVLLVHPIRYILI
ncbi:hypothetical protein [Photobacterium carnosum]|uniref:hypothetical protein n=1 Tax=Photobacterium carnosum TaxID=2023717 RepID=UPI001E390F8D|nr:hypothetical protein [Photobacterium carnosum]MCD9527551.1 hypothetical protein [Photobacterium carnosum]